MTESNKDSIDLLEKASSGKWLSFEEGLFIYRHASTKDLVHASSKRTAQLWGGAGSARTYMMYYLLNYSNVCAENCQFCNYWASKDSPKSWTYSFDDVHDSLQKYYEYGGRVILFQGGNHYGMDDFSYYTNFLSSIREHYPDILVFGTSPTEIEFWSKKYNLPIPRVISELKGAGLKAIAGAGAEIAHQPIRDLLFKKKVSFKDWLDIMDEACAQGLSASASLMYGTYDGLSEEFEGEFCRLEHMDLLRERQGKTSHYRAFVAWPYQPNQDRIRSEPAPHEEYVRLMCMARLYLRNFPTLQSSYLSLGQKEFSDSLSYSVNCAGGILFTPEKVTGSVGAEPNDLSRSQIIEWIKSGGYEAEERDYYGRILADPYTGRNEMNNLSLDKSSYGSTH